MLDQIAILALYLAIEDLIIAELAAEIRECRWCRPGVRLCATHRAMLEQIPPCPDPECWACRPTS